MEKEGLDIEALREKREQLRQKKKKRKNLLVLGVLTVAVVIVLCCILSNRNRAVVNLEQVKQGKTAVIQKDAARKKCLNIYADDMSGAFSPAYAVNYGDQIVSDIVFEPLMKRNENGDLEEFLVKKLKVSEDGLTYTVTLKEDLLFSDGSAVTVKDVFASMTAMILAENAGAAEDSYLRIAGMTEYLKDQSEFPEGLTELSEKELQITFNEASPDNLLVMETQIQKGNYGETLDDKGVVTEVLNHYGDGIGTGAYGFTETSEGSVCTLQANEYYREKIKDIQTIEFCGIAYYDLPEAIGAGTIDMAIYSGKSQLFETLYDWEGFSVYSKPEETVYALYYNQENEALTGKKVRQAISYAFDREDENLAQALPYVLLEDGMALTAGSAGNAYGYDQSKAKKLLKEAAKEMKILEDGLSLTLPVLESSEVQKQLAGALKEDLQEIGITLEIQELSQQDYVQTLYLREDFDLYLTEISVDGSVGSFQQYYQPEDALTIDVTEESVEEAYEALTKSYSVGEVEKQKAAFLSAIEESASVMVLGRSRNFISVSADLSGFEATPHQQLLGEIHKIKVK